MGIETVVYASREDVTRAVDIKHTARTHRQVDRALQAATRSVEGLCHRTFYPVQATRLFDWPTEGGHGRPWRIWLNQHDLITLDSISSGGQTIDTGDVLPEPVNTGPPFRWIELDLDSSASFGQGPTYQRDVSITGLWGYRNDETNVATLAANIADPTTTTVDVSDGSQIGVGHLLRTNSERMTVRARRFLDSGQTLQADLAAQVSDDMVQVTDGTAYNVDEILLLDSERLLIVDIAGNNLAVKRAWDGSTLAAHSGPAVFASRRLTVERGVLGTTAATHTQGDTVHRHDPPSLVRDLTVAEAIAQVEQEQAAYARTVGSGDNQREAAGRALAGLRDQCRTRYGRKARTRAI